MYIPKCYGRSRIDNCPFCNKQAVTKNNQGVPVCNAHKKEKLSGFLSVCGEPLDLRTGKYGVYFNCINCGNISLRKALETNTKKVFRKDFSIPYKKKGKVPVDKKPKEMTVRSDDPIHCY